MKLTLERHYQFIFPRTTDMNYSHVFQCELELDWRECALYSSRSLHASSFYLLVSNRFRLAVNLRSQQQEKTKIGRRKQSKIRCKSRTSWYLSLLQSNSELSCRAGVGSSKLATNTVDYNNLPWSAHYVSSFDTLTRPISHDKWNKTKQSGGMQNTQVQGQTWNEFPFLLYTEI